MPDRDYASEALARIPGTPEHQAAQRTARKSGNGADLAGNGPHTDQAKPDPPNAFKPRSPPHAPWSYHDGTEPAATAQLVKNILPETGTGLIAGQWGTYKTTVALDISVSVMTGIPFAERFTVRRRGGVAYFALEGAGGLASRLAAIARTRGVAGALPFAYRPDAPPLTASGALVKLLALVEEAGRHIKDQFAVPLALIFFDTIIAAAGYAKSGDDNDAATAQKTMSVLAGLSQRTGALVLGLDHFGKIIETGTRGSSAKEGHADVVLALLGDRELGGAVTNTRLAIRKARDGIAGLEIPFTPNTVEIGTDADGDPITRVIINWNPPKLQTAIDDKEGWSKSLRLLRRIFITAIADAGQDVQPFTDGPTVRACDMALVRAEFFKQYVADGDTKQKTNARRMAFNRAVASAQAKGLIETRELDGRQWAWFVKVGSS